VLIAAITTPSPSPAPSTAPATDSPSTAIVADPNSWFDWLVGTPLRIVIVIVAALVLRILWRRLINSSVEGMARSAEKKARIQDRTMATALDDLLPSQRRRQRAEAIGALIGSIGTAVIFCVAILLILGALGIDLAPLIAGAGIAGVALGFGAQSLVKDFISGVFMILEDQYGVGDVIDTGFVTGEVEDVGLRVTRVRDVNGIVWYVRNGEVIRIGNRSQGWATAIADLPVGYDENLDRVRAIVDSVGAAMLEDPEYNDKLLEAPEFIGVESVAGDAVTVRITARTAPQQQLAVARAIRERVKDAFDAEGVRVPIVPRAMAMPPPPTNAP
jgi:small conductance mechanosensitive channel